MRTTTTIQQLASKPLSFNYIDKTEMSRLVIVREPTYFSIDTADNPYMIAAMSDWQDEAAAQSDLSQDEFLFRKKEDLKKQAALEHKALTDAFRRHNIPCFTILPEKGKLEDGTFNHKTDEVFATDTGQFYFDKNKLHYIPGNFANPQRFGEERLAIIQAISSLKASVSYLRHPDTGELLKFEGGDIRQAPGRKLFFVGHGHRNDPAVIDAIKKSLDPSFIILPIELRQPKYYHVDCCFLPLPDECAMVYEGDYVYDSNGELVVENSDPNDEQSEKWPVIIKGTETMSPASRSAIRQLYDANHLILISEAEAAKFGANAVFVRTTEEEEKNIIFIPAGSLTELSKSSLKEKINGVVIEEVPFDTMHYSGGSVRCSTQEVPCSPEYLRELKLNKQIPIDDALQKISIFKCDASHVSIKRSASFSL